MLNRLQAQVAARSAWPEAANHLQLETLGVSGFRRLYDLLDADDPIRGEITTALVAYDGYLQRRVTLSHRLIQRRRWYYRNLAVWLCSRYREIAIEDDTNLARLHWRSANPALAEAAVYRNYAAVGELRAYLRAAATKTGCVTGGKAPNTTTVCFECGAPVEGERAALVLRCPNGHEWDQDKNSGRNLLSQIDGSFGQTHVLRRSGPPEWKKLEIPSTIRAVAVEVPAQPAVKPSGESVAGYSRFPRSRCCFS